MNHARNEVKLPGISKVVHDVETWNTRIEIIDRYNMSRKYRGTYPEEPLRGLGFHRNISYYFLDHMVTI